MANTISYAMARRVINPEVPVSLAGYFNIRMVTEIFDDIEVRALALKSGASEFLLVQYDLLTVSTVLYERVLAKIADLPQYSRKNVLFTATHTHTAPNYRETCKASDPRYMEALVETSAEAIREAAAAPKATGTMSCGKTFDDRFIFNRRYWMKDGSVTTNPGKLNPNIDKPEGPIDAEIPLAAIVNSETGKIDVLLANIVNHTDTIGGTEVSADWAGFTRRILEKDCGIKMMFPLIGAAGNINHFDTSTDMNQTQYAEAERIGSGYAETIKAALSGLKTIEGGELIPLYGEVEAGPAEISEKEVADARATVEKFKDVEVSDDITLTSEDLANGAPFALKYFANALIGVAENPLNFCFPISGFQFGEFVMASLPSEPFTEIGQTIKNEIYAGKNCFVVSHGNGTGSLKNHGGYIPNLWNYDRGGYETEILSNPFERHTAEKLIEGWKKIASTKD